MCTWAILKNIRLVELCVALFEMPTGIFTLFSMIRGGYTMGTHWVSLIFLLKKSWQSLCLVKLLGAGFMGMGPCMELSMGPIPLKPNSLRVCIRLMRGESGRCPG